MGGPVAAWVAVVARLLERDGELTALDRAVTAAEFGGGSVVLVLGEAGIGKTTLLRAFRRRLPASTTVLAGTCDDLLTPRALGPLRDAAGSAGEALHAALEAGDVDALYAAMLDELTRGRPTVLVVEDVHWADDGTLDVLRFASRRAAELPAMVVLTLRDDALPREHPVERLLGDLTGPQVTRLRLQPLSPQAVQALAGSSAAEAGRLRFLTGGNPFLLTEVLRCPTSWVPAGVVDAVLARVRRLEPKVREALERLSVVPGRVEDGLVDVRDRETGEEHRVSIEELA